MEVQNVDFSRVFPHPGEEFRVVVSKGRMCVAEECEAEDWDPICVGLLSGEAGFCECAAVVPESKKAEKSGENGCSFDDGPVLEDECVDCEVLSCAWDFLVGGGE